MRALPTLLLLSTLLLSGCFYSREIAHTRRDIEAQFPSAHFDHTVTVNLGPLSLRTLRWVSGLVHDEDVRLARAYLRDLSRVKVGVSEVERLPTARTAFDLPRLRRLERNGWEVAVKMQEEGESVWVLYRERRGAIRDLYAIVLNEEELVVARVKGRLSHLIERALEDHATLEELVHLDFREKEDTAGPSP